MKKLLLLIFILIILFTCTNNKEDKKNGIYVIYIGKSANIKGAHIQYNGMINDKIFSISRIGNIAVNLYLSTDMEAFSFISGDYIYNLEIVQVDPYCLTLKFYNRLVNRK